MRHPGRAPRHARRPAAAQSGPLLLRQSSRPLAFPGGTPGRHLTTESVRGELVAHGIHPLQARMAALFQLAGQMPTPVLSDLLGISTLAATRWSALAAKDWSSYTANRRTSQG